MNKDLIIGLLLMFASCGLIALILGHAIAHDCAHNPPLPSSVFGRAVPIEAICAAVR